MEANTENIRKENDWEGRSMNMNFHPMRIARRTAEMLGFPPSDDDSSTSSKQNKQTSETHLSPSVPGTMKDQPFTTDMQENIDLFSRTFHGDKNQDLIRREILLTTFTEGSNRLILFYLSGMIDTEKLSSLVIEPLQSATLPTEAPLFTYIQENVITAVGVGRMNRLQQAAESLLLGHTILFAPQEPSCLSINLAKLSKRSVGEAKTEVVIRGPHEAFIESLGTNVSLIRKYVVSPSLVTEYIQSEGPQRSRIAILYLADVTNEDLIAEVRHRLQKCIPHSVDGSPILAQMIEDRPYSLLPTVTLTERPDRSGGMLYDGHVIVLADHSPLAMICPTTFWTLFHTSEETYLRTPYANFIRLIRILACFFALFAPGTYLALTNYQHEMIPPDLMFSIAGSREALPFPSWFEILMMEMAFELIREAGVRIPAVVGSTIGIVGALILGQAAVQANIISPLLVILISLTGLGSFAIPNVDLSYAIRIGRFAFLLLGCCLGFYGLAWGTMLMLCYMVSLRSFGVPFLSPLYPHMKANHDYIFRTSLWKQNRIGKHLSPKRLFRFQGTSRMWEEDSSEDQ